PYGSNVIATTATDTLFSIENVIGTNSNDIIGGSSVGNKLWGMDGNDRLDGMDGNDSLFGGNGADGLSGGRGDDFLDGGDRLFGGGSDFHRQDDLPQIGDTVNYLMSTTGVNVDLTSTGPQSGGDAQGDILTNIQSVRGSIYGDHL